MSLYNMLYGHNNNSAVIVSAFLGYDVTKVIPRYRDTFLDINQETNLPTGKFEIYTRMGGGNYGCWNEDEIDFTSKETILEHERTCNCPYHQLLKIEKEPWYKGAEDDDFDSTYRTLNGEFSKEFLEKLEKVFVTNTFVPIMEDIKKVFPNLIKDEGDEKQ